MTTDIATLPAVPRPAAVDPQVQRGTEARNRLLLFTCFLVTAVTLIPVVMMVIVALQSDAESMATRPALWPDTWHPENFARVFELVPVARYLGNTVIFAAGTTVLETATAALAPTPSPGSASGGARRSSGSTWRP
jgi:multiple sugar transport system permease protein